MVREVVSMAASGDVLVSIGKDLILCTWSIRTKVTCTGGDYKEDNVNDSLGKGAENQNGNLRWHLP